MDLSLGSQADALLVQARAGAQEVRLQQLAAAAEGGTADRGELQKAAQEFEGVFLNQLLQAMRRTVPENELFNGGGATKFYQQMHDAELANALSRGAGRMGLADLIVRQLEPAAAGQEAPGPLPAVPTPAQALSRYRALSGALDDARTRGLEVRAQAAERDTLRVHGTDLRRAAADHGVSPALLLAVVMEESAGDPAALSHRGAVGLTQLMPGTAREMGVDDPRDPAQNLAGGARYLGRMMERYDGRLDLALAAYNAGPGAVDRAGGGIPPYPETQQYVDRVLARYRRLEDGTELANPGR